MKIDYMEKNQNHFTSAFLLEDRGVDPPIEETISYGTKDSSRFKIS